ncbi:Equilibrative Nucleoside Transporter [Blattamonas nauphoetae]|uniref:Equilibrative Nucleoside Transporter n=1 Tax=Blattamonas nauphoetae TaxID=2049346 RepID=A0ABQ9YJY5_9EUKA|nr:Equilibrative Nucleoside Transporter [Blattamonas nauphoetae]
MGKLKDHPERDSYHLVYILFIIFGGAMLSAWNAIISASAYFEQSLPSKHAMNFMLVAYNVGVLPFMFLTTVYSSELNYTIFIGVPFVAAAALMICVPFICTYLKMKMAALVLMMIVAFICGMGTGVLNTSVFGLGGVFAGSSAGGIMIGQGFVGLLSLIPLILHLSIPGDNTQTIGLIFFIFAACLNVIAFVCILLFKKIPFAKYTLDKYEQSKHPERVPLLKAEDQNRVNSKAEDLVEYQPTEEGAVVLKGCSKIKAFVKQLFGVLRRMKWYALAVFLCYFVTLFIYPSAILSVPSPKGMFTTDWQIALWIHIRLNIFAVSDFISRWIPQCIKLYKSPALVVIVSLVRVIFAVLLVIARWVVWMRNLPFFITIYAIFSLMNGYHGTLIMSVAADQCDIEPSKRGVAGSTMAFVLNCGIALGCFLALPLGAALK